MLNVLTPNVVNTICERIFKYINSPRIVEEFTNYDKKFYDYIEYYSYNRRLITSLNSLMIFNPMDLRDMPVGLVKIKFVIGINGNRFDYATIFIDNTNNDIIVSLKNCTNQKLSMKLEKCLGSLNFYQWLIKN